VYNQSDCDWYLMSVKLEKIEWPGGPCPSPLQAAADGGVSVPSFDGKRFVDETALDAMRKRYGKPDGNGNGNGKDRDAS